jgi:hypothetical protein
MAETASVPAKWKRAWPDPWPTAFVGLALVGTAALLRLLAWPILTPACLPLVIVGFLVAGRAVERGLRRLREEWEGRLEIGSLLGLVSLAPLLGYAAMDATWDSGKMLMTAMLAVGIGGTVLVLLARPFRLALISLLILVHFGGILTAVVSVDPPGQVAPALSNWAWVYFYRPYLGFMYLNNAYHFYSPEPGPPTLVWSHITYSNGKDYKMEWVKLPDRETSPVPLHHQRLLSIAENTNQLMPYVADLEARMARRNQVTQEVPFHPLVPYQNQCRMPIVYSQTILQAFARHMARTHPQLEGSPEYKFHNVKIYRVIHNCLEARDLVLGFSPLDKTLYHAYFQGTFDSEGELKNPRDPLLYWLIPIVRAHPRTDPKTGLAVPPDPKDPDEGLMNYLEIHAKMID